MPVLTQDEFHDLVGTELATNGAGLVTAARLRNVMQAVEDKFWEWPRVRTLESFGAVSTDFDMTGANDAAGAVDNRQKIQDAIDWSSATAGVVLAGAGVYGFAGTLRLKNDMALIGMGRNNTMFQQLDTSWPTCFAPVVSDTPATDGVAYITMRGFALHGGWNLQKNISTSGNWRNYTTAEMTQRGIQLYSPMSGVGDLVPRNRYGGEDSFNLFEDIAIRRIAGIGIEAGGRGEMFFNLIRIAQTATDGMVMSSVDNWMNDVTIHVTGDCGLKISGGNQRLNNVKPWYCGMMVTNEPNGVGLELQTGSMTSCSIVNLSTQDTYGPGLRARGHSMFIRGHIDEVSGGRMVNAGQGFQGTRTRSNSALEVFQSEFCSIELGMTGADRGKAPHLVHFSGTNSWDNEISLAYNRDQASPWWNAAVPVLTSSGYNAAKRWNLVKTHEKNGIILHGAVTREQLADATHGVNFYKGFGFKVTLSDGHEATKLQSLPTSPWRISDGSTITPAG